MSGRVMRNGEVGRMKLVLLLRSRRLNEVCLPTLIVDFD